MIATVNRPRARRQPGAATASTGRVAPRSPNRFVRAREARQTEVAEDYVELIDDLIVDTGEARAADVARALGVTQATVTNTIARLVRDGLVTCQPYRSIFLTKRGQTLAKWSRDRHRIVRGFLLAIGVSSDTADADSEGLEHHVSEETLAALKRLTDSLTKER
jgi:DtxR family transcriptional regulator, manganese transport regulator